MLLVAFAVYIDSRVITYINKIREIPPLTLQFVIYPRSNMIPPGQGVITGPGTHPSSSSQSSLREINMSDNLLTR